MLSNDVIRKINRQIEDELRTVDSICSDQQEKLDAIERIAKLKELLTPQPSIEEIAQRVAAILQIQQQPTPQPAPIQTDILRNLASFFPKK